MSLHDVIMIHSGRPRCVIVVCVMAGDEYAGDEAVRDSARGEHCSCDEETASLAP